MHILFCAYRGVQQRNCSHDILLGPDGLVTTVTQKGDEPFAEGCVVHNATPDASTLVDTKEDTPLVRHLGATREEKPLTS